MSTAANSESYAFATFEVDADARELRREGTLQTIQPKVFDLLVYLIRNRNRVVSKSELLDKVWASADVNENVIARAIMRAREAIGDKSEGGRMVRTVHRVGYRFCADEAIAPAVVAAMANRCSADAGPNSAEADENAAIRIVVMPMGNRIANADFGWVALGLSSLIARTLEADSRFSVVPVTTMLQTLATLPASATSAQQTDRLVHVLGAQCVLHATVHGEAPAFSIEFHGGGPRGFGLDGHLDGTDLIDLGEWLAREVERHAFPRPGAALHYGSINALVNQTFACALQARHEQRYDAAIKLIEAVLTIEPDNADAMLFQLQVMMKTTDERVMAVGATLLQHPKFLAAPRLRAQAHATLGLASMLLAESGRTAQHHAEQAVRLIGTGRSDESALRIYGICGVIANSYGDPARARVFAEYCIDKHRRSGDRFSLSLNLTTLAAVDIEEGDIEAARSRLQESIAFLRQNGFTNTLMAALVKLAHGVHVPSGEWALAVSCCDEARSLLTAFGGQRNSILWVATMSIVYAEMSMPESIEAAMSTLATPDEGDDRPLHAAWLTARAHRSIAAGDLEAAREPLAKALAVHRATRSVTNMRRGAALFLRNEIRAGHSEAARSTAEALLAEEPSMTLDGEIEGLHLHAIAATAHATGDEAVAVASIGRAIDCLPRGALKAFAAMDAAWLALDSARLSDAEAILAQIPDWTLEHPKGRAAMARLRSMREGNVDASLDRKPTLLSVS